MPNGPEEDNGALLGPELELDHFLLDRGSNRELHGAAVPCCLKLVKLMGRTLDVNDEHEAMECMSATRVISVRALCMAA